MTREIVVMVLGPHPQASAELVRAREVLAAVGVRVRYDRSGEVWVGW